MKLYSKTLIDLSKETKFVGVLDKATHDGQLSNPLCGDRVGLSIFATDHHIERILHHTRGCALCQASTSLLCAELEGIELAQLPQVAQQTLNTLQQMANGTHSDVPSHLSIFTDIQSAPARLKCLTLPWDLVQSLFPLNLQ